MSDSSQNQSHATDDQPDVDGGANGPQDRNTPTNESTDSNEDHAATHSDLADVRAQVEVLQEENRRLRADYTRARQAEYRRAALGLATLGVVAVLGGLLFPTSQPTLFGLGGIGLFSAVLIYYLIPEQVAAASVGERAYAAFATFGEAISADLGLQDTQVYVPMTSGTNPGSLDVRLFIPLHTTYRIPSPETLASVFVVETDDQTRGVSVPPTGALLLREFRETMVDDLATTPADLTDQLTEAVVAGFELADDAVAELAADEGRVTIGVRGSTFGPIDRFDHPLPSFIAAGLAGGLHTPVERAAITTDDEQFEYVVTYTWEATETDDGTADVA